MVVEAVVVAAAAATAEAVGAGMAMMALAPVVVVVEAESLLLANAAWYCSNSPGCPGGQTLCCLLFVPRMELVRSPPR